MKILFIHSDSMEFKVTGKAVVEAEPLTEEYAKVSDALVCFVAVESSDTDSILQNAQSEIKDIADKLQTKQLVLYPYAHLSSDLADPETAKNLITKLADILKHDYQVLKAPFGWYKAFTISCKGHPLSELSKTIKEEYVPKALEMENKIVSHWKILHHGNFVDVDDFDFRSYPELKLFTDYEISGTRAVSGIPPHVQMMQQMELVGYEEGSDSGNFRYYPKGRMIKSLLEEYVSRKMREYGAMELETPIMYDYEHPALKSYLQRFPARQYTLLSGESRFFLRFSACFGQFLVAKDAVISYKQFPIKIYELTRYSFRREKRGELVGLRRLRAFTMPDLHTLTLNLESAKSEFLEQFKFSMRVLKEIGIKDYEVAVRFTKEFWENNKEFVQSLEKVVNKPILIQMWDARFFYFILKFEFNFVDTMRKGAALSTVQLDIENSQRFNITYYDEKGEKKYPLILHWSPSGAIERVIYAILEEQEKAKKKGLKPSFPLWLAPSHVRIVPVSEDYYSRSDELAVLLNNAQIRADFDDRELTMQKKIREAEKEWVPYILVIGEKEQNSGKVTCRIRETGKILEYEIEDLIKEIKEQVKNYPYKPIPINYKMSMRIKFS